jgi:hypothetical protein
MTCGFIYKIVFPNGKHYIGLTTTSLEQRRKEHKLCAKNGDEKCLYKALRKYNMVDTFELIEIDATDTLEELCEKEKGYIVEYNSYYIEGNGYNMTHGGEGTNGYVFTEEDKQKNSERKKQYFANPEARKKQSERIKEYYEQHPKAGKEHSEKMKIYYEEKPEAREKMSEIKKKHYEDKPEAGKEHSERMKIYYEENLEAKKKLCETLHDSHKKWLENDSDARRKMSRGKLKPFDIFTKDGTFIKTFTYQFEAIEYLQKEYKITSRLDSKITDVLSGRRKSTAGFVFKYK